MAFPGRGVRGKKGSAFCGTHGKTKAASLPSLKVGLGPPSVTSGCWHTAGLLPQEPLCLGVVCTAV